MLYLPNCYALSAKSAAAIREFVRGGGTVWADGLVAWKNEEGVARQFPPGPLSDVFGFTVEDIDAVWEPFSIGGGSDRAGDLWRCVIPAGAGRVLLKGADGRPNAVEHVFGKGRALYYGSAVTLRYLHRGGEEARVWIAGPAIAAARDVPVRLAAGPALVSFRVLAGPGGAAAVLNNWGAAGRAEIQFPGATQAVRERVGGGEIRLRAAGGVKVAEIELARWQSAVLMG